MNGKHKLAIMAVNELLRSGFIYLTPPTTREAEEAEKGHVYVILAGRGALINWRNIGFGELRISVWWDYDHNQHPQKDAPGNCRERFTMSSPLAKRQHYPNFVGVVFSFYLERQNGKYLQCHGKQLAWFDTYVRRDMHDILNQLPDVAPEGYSAIGKFHM